MWNSPFGDSCREIMSPMTGIYLSRCKAYANKHISHSAFSLKRYHRTYSWPFADRLTSAFAICHKHYNLTLWTLWTFNFWNLFACKYSYSFDTFHVKLTCPFIYYLAFASDLPVDTKLLSKVCSALLLKFNQSQNKLLRPSGILRADRLKSMGTLL